MCYSLNIALHCKTYTMSEEEAGQFPSYLCNKARKKIKPEHLFLVMREILFLVQAPPSFTY